MACQAVAAFMLELAHLAFLALPGAVVAIAGSHWRVCQGLLGPGCVAWSVVLCFGTPGELSYIQL